MSLLAQEALAGRDFAAPPGGYRGGINNGMGGGATQPPYMNPPGYTNPVYSQTPVSPPPGIPPLPPPVSSSGSTGGSPAPAPAPVPPSTPAPSTPAVPQISPMTAQNALNNFANSAGMKFAEQQGANAVNNLYAAHGQLQSGAAAKAISNYIQNMALQNYFMPYMNYLTGQQAMGAQAASAIGGVGSSYGGTVAGMGQNYANAASNINNGMGNALGQGAINIGNANANQAIIGGLANANLGSAIGSGLGQIGSSFFQPGSSMPTYNGSTPISTSLGTAQPVNYMPGGFY